MASAGRILIIPKGEWNAETEYEMLDLVYHNGTSWLAKKDVVGIEPSDANKEYWHKFIDIKPENIGSVQRTIWKWVANDGDSLFSYIKSKLSEGYTCGMIQVEIPNGKIADIPDSIRPRVGSYFMCHFQRHYYNYVRATIWGDTSTYEYSNWGVSTEEAFATGWVERACPEGYFRNSGGTLNGNVAIENQWATLSLKDDSGRIVFIEKNPATNVLSIYTYLDSNNHNNLMLAPETTDIEDSLVLRNVVDGSAKLFKIFGQHNIDLLNQYIDARITEYHKNN